MKNMKKLTSLLLALLLLVQVVPTAVLADNEAESAVQEIVTEDVPDMQESLPDGDVTEEQTDEQTETPTESIPVESVEVEEEQQKEEEEPLVSVVSDVVNEGKTANTGAAEDITVYVTISNAGELVMTRQAITLTGKSTYNIDDALRAAHEAAGKSEKYYSYNDAQYGLCLGTLWGDSSGWFGYYVNTSSANGLSDSVKSDDQIYAYVYNDKSFPSKDAFSYFNTTAASVSKSGTLELTLKYVSGSNADYSPIFSVFPNATITIDGEEFINPETKEAYTTDSEGKVTLSFADLDIGKHVISAVSNDENVILVPPVCVVTVCPTVYVTIRDNGAGTFCLTHEAVVVPADEDGNFTVGSALAQAHTDAGHSEWYDTEPYKYTYDKVEYSSVRIRKLWNIDTTAIMYYINGVSANGLSDSVGNDAEIYAFIYSDKSYYSDTYTWFDKIAIDANMGDSVTLTLSYGYYDASNKYAFTTVPLSGASITINGFETNLTTDYYGQVTVPITAAGETFISATYSGKTIIPPICTVTTEVTADSSPLGSTLLYGSEDATSATAFSKDTAEYWVTLPATTKSVTLSSGTGKYKLDSAEQANLDSSKSTSLAIGAGTHTLTVTCGDDKTYTFHVTRKTALETFTATQNEAKLPLDKEFVAATYLNGGYEAKATIPAGSITLNCAAYDTANTTIKVSVDGADPSALTTEYNLTAGEHTITVSTAPNGTSYTLKLTVCEQVAYTVNIPKDAYIEIKDPNGNKVTLPTVNATSAFCDSYAFTGLLSGAKYTYTVGKQGYTSATGNFTVSNGGKTDIVLNTSGTGFVDENVDWKNFRNSDVNMAITYTELPTTGETAKLKWASEESLLDSSWMNGAGFVMDNGYIYTTQNGRVVKVDLETGEIKAKSKQMECTGIGTYGSISLCLGDGKVFVPLIDGRVQAFDASTLKSVWVSESLGNQCTVSPIYKDGYLYGATGYSSTSSFVYCIDVTDTDTANETETKLVTWKADISSYFGSYWSTPVIVGNYLIIGTSNENEGGENKLLSINCKAGQIASSKTISAKQNTGIVYDNGRVWFMTRDGSLCNATVNTENGELGDIKSFSNSYTYSTATPIIYNGVAYIQVTKKINGKNTYWFAAVDVSVPDNMKLVAEKQLDTTGALQSSPILSTAFEGSGKLYFYFTQNEKPGALYAACYDTNAKTFTISTIYTPETEKQNYCVFSPVCDDEGTIYYRNDSGYIFAIENLVGIGLDRESVVLSVGESYPLTANVVTTGNSKLTYGSSDPTVATVDKEGNITAVAPGEATITVKTDDNRYSATCRVTVKSTTILYSENSTAFVSEPTGTLPSGATLTHKQTRSDKDRTVLRAEKALAKYEELEGRVYSVDELSIETVTGKDFTVTAPLTAGVAMSKTYLNSSSYKPVAAVLKGSTLTFLDTEVSGNYATFSPVTDLDATYVMLLLTDDSAREALNNTEDTTDYDAIIDKINSADEGDTIRLNITSSSKIPWAVFDALENAEKNVTLNIVSKKYQWKFVSDDVDVPDNASGTFDPWVRLLEQEDTADKSFEGQKYLSVTFRDTDQEIPGRSTLIFSTTDTALSSADNCTLYGITGDGDVTDAAGRFLFDDGDCAMTVTTTRQYVVLAADGKASTAEKKDEAAETASSGSAGTAGTSSSSSLAPAPITQAEKDTNRELEEERKEPVVTLDLSEYEAFMKEAVENQQTLSDALEEAKTSYADAVSTLKSEKQSAVIKTAVISVLGTSAVWALILLGAKKKKNGEDEGK